MIDSKTIRLRCFGQSTSVKLFGNFVGNMHLSVKILKKQPDIAKTLVSDAYISFLKILTIGPIQVNDIPSRLVV